MHLTVLPVISSQLFAKFSTNWLFLVFLRTHSVQKISHWALKPASFHKFNPFFPAVIWKRPIKVRNLKPFSLFVFFFVLAFEITFSQTRSIESRCVKGPENTLKARNLSTSLNAYRYLFWRFCSESTSLSLHRYVLVSDGNMAAALRVFRGFDWPKCSGDWQSGYLFVCDTVVVSDTRITALVVPVTVDIAAVSHRVKRSYDKQYIVKIRWESIARKNQGQVR